MKPSAGAANHGNKMEYGPLRPRARTVSAQPIWRILVNLCQHLHEKILVLIEAATGIREVLEILMRLGAWTRLDYPHRRQSAYLMKCCTNIYCKWCTRLAFILSYTYPRTWSYLLHAVLTDTRLMRSLLNVWCSLLGHVSMTHEWIQ